MGELTDKIKGNVNEAVGKAKQHSDDPDTRDEGAGQELKGKAEQVKGVGQGRARQQGLNEEGAVTATAAPFLAGDQGALVLAAHAEQDRRR